MVLFISVPGFANMTSNDSWLTFDQIQLYLNTRGWIQINAMLLTLYICKPILKLHIIFFPIPNLQYYMLFYHMKLKKKLVQIWKSWSCMKTYAGHYKWEQRQYCYIGSALAHGLLLLLHHYMWIISSILHGSTNPSSAVHPLFCTHSVWLQSALRNGSFWPSSR